MDPKIMLRTHLVGLWQRRWSIILVTWIVCLAGWAVVAILPDRYTSTAQIYVNNATVLAPLMRGLAVQPEVTQGVEVMRRTLLTRPNLERLVRLTDLDLTANTPLEREELINHVIRHLRVTAAQDLYQVSYDDPDPALAQRMVEALLQIFVEQNLGYSRRDLENSRRFVEAQVAEYERQLRAAEQRLAEFQQSHAEELSARDTAQARLQNGEFELRRLETEMQASIWRRDQLRTELATLPETLDEAREGANSAASTRLSELRTQLNALRMTYTEDYPDVIATRRLIAQAEAELARNQNGTAGGSGTAVRRPNPTYERIKGELDRLELDIAARQRQIDLQRSELQQLRNVASEVPQVQAELTQLNRDYSVLLRNYEELLARRESTRITQRMDTETSHVEFRIVEPPVVPVQPSGPQRKLLSAGVLLAGIAAGVAVALVRNVLTDSFASLAHLRDTFGLPVLGSISPARNGTGRRRKAMEVSALASTLVVLLLLFGALNYYNIKVNRAELPHAVGSIVGQAGSSF